MPEDQALSRLHRDDLIDLIGVLRRDVADAMRERDRLRAVVDALIEWRDAQMRMTMADIVRDISDARDEAETARQTVWLALAMWEEGLDVSGDTGRQ